MLTTDLLLSPFGASGPELVEAARVVDQAGYGGIWTLDHFSGSMVDRPWSREPFTMLGALAAATRTALVGPLVANVVNRHPVLLASASATLQSLSEGRLVLGLGAGAGPGALYASEQDAIARPLGDLSSRRRRLVEAIEVIRLLWRGGGDHRGEFYELQGLRAVVGPEPEPPIVVGAGSAGTVELAVDYADGVNVPVRPGWEELIGLARDLAGGRPFETSVYGPLDADHETGGELDPLLERGVDRRILVVRAPFPLERIRAIADRLARL